jgi:hypothetical protein
MQMQLTIEQGWAVWRLWAADIRCGLIPGDRLLAAVLCKMLDWAKEQPHLKTGETVCLLVNKLLHEGSLPPTFPELQKKDSRTDPPRVCSH